MAATAKRKAKPRVASRSVEVVVELPSVKYSDGYYNRSNGTFKLKREGDNIVVHAPCGDRVATFSKAQFEKAAALIVEDVKVVTST